MVHYGDNETTRTGPAAGRGESHQVGFDTAISVILWSRQARSRDYGRRVVGDGPGDRAAGPLGSGLGLVNLKKLIVLLVVAFLLFFLITQPTGSANVVTTILDWLKEGATAIVTFVKSLFA
jgi:hypothetical protein